MTVLALGPPGLTRVRQAILAGRPQEQWALAVCDAQPLVHGHRNLPAFVLALHTPTVGGWLYVAHRFAHVPRLPRMHVHPRAISAVTGALAIARQREPLARWLAQLARPLELQ